MSCEGCSHLLSCLQACMEPPTSAGPAYLSLSCCRGPGLRVLKDPSPAAASSLIRNRVKPRGSPVTGDRAPSCLVIIRGLGLLPKFSRSADPKSQHLPCAAPTRAKQDRSQRKAMVLLSGKMVPACFGALFMSPGIP